MRHRIHVLVHIFLTSLLLLVAGCYTRFATLEQEYRVPEHAVTVIDSNGNTVTVDKRTDTVPAADQETCIWERDLMGFPVLRCYKGYYPRQWYRYNFSPWWYRADDHLYSAGRCPSYYYYDNNCGCCRYYLNNPSLLSSGSADTVKKELAPAQGTPNDPDGQKERVNISAGSRTTYSSRQRLKTEQTHAPPQAPSNSSSVPGAAARSDSTGTKVDSVSTGPPAPGVANQTPVQDQPPPAIRQSQRQDSAQAPPARAPIRRSMRSR